MMLGMLVETKLWERDEWKIIIKKKQCNAFGLRAGGKGPL